MTFWGKRPSPLSRLRTMCCDGCLAWTMKTAIVHSWQASQLPAASHRRLRSSRSDGAKSGGLVLLPKLVMKRRATRISRRAGGEMLPLECYCGPILRALLDNGGELRSRDVPAAVGPYIVEQLRPTDLEIEGNGLPVWHKRIGWAGTMCRKDGHIDPESPRGTWRITDEGRRNAIETANERTC